ncbi:MAG: response regulator transcription factor [Mycobacterium sp.]
MPEGSLTGTFRADSLLLASDLGRNQRQALSGRVRMPAATHPAAGMVLSGLRPMCDPAERQGQPASPPIALGQSKQLSANGSDIVGGVRGATILIVDDCTLQRENLATILGGEGGSTLAVAWDLPSMRDALAETSPEVVLVSMVSRDSITLLRAVREACPGARVIVVGISEDDETDIIACAEAGVAGYHLRNESLDQLLRLISKVVEGESSCSPRVSAILLSRLSALAAQRNPGPRELVLTTREMQILQMLEMGLSNRDIADRLCITLHTVKNHVHSVLNKLGVSTRTEAAAVSRSFR